jgi:hypothetical protein
MGMAYERRAGLKKPVHVWLSPELIDKIRAENAKVNGGSYWRRETLQKTFERILGAFFPEPKVPAKNGKKK